VEGSNKNVAQGIRRRKGDKQAPVPASRRTSRENGSGQKSGPLQTESNIHQR
jgi:hypothetical protein